MIPPALHSFICLSVSLVPVVLFLVTLIILDSFKLVRLRAILFAILYGSITAFGSLWINSGLMELFGIKTSVYARYIAPIIEEVLKAALLVQMMRNKRIGFMVDAAIYGFAVGAGFAIVENVYYFKQLSDLNVLLWLIRGFGTAVMHGGVTAIMGIISKAFSDSRHSAGVTVYLPGLLAAIGIHSAYNHFFISPMISTVGLLVVLPALIMFVFRRSERTTREWLGVRFDTDAELLRLINVGGISGTRVGEYLRSLKSKFSPEVVVDMLCLLRLHLELSIRAKGILLMREAGFRIPPDAEVKERFSELRYLEKSIGKTGQLAIAPILRMSSRELWQLHTLGKQ